MATSRDGNERARARAGSGSLPEPMKHAAVLGRVQGQALRVAAEDAASLDMPCARRCVKSTVGAEECSQRGLTKEWTQATQADNSLEY